MITSVVVLIKDGDILAVSRKDNHEDFGLIGGKSEDIDGDNPELTAIRETKEETGLDIEDLKLILLIPYGNSISYCYLAKIKEGSEINYNEPHVVKWTNFKTIIDGKFGDYNTMVANSLKVLGIKYNE